MDVFKTDDLLDFAHQYFDELAKISDAKKKRSLVIKSIKDLASAPNPANKDLDAYKFMSQTMNDNLPFDDSAKNPLYVQSTVNDSVFSTDFLRKIATLMTYKQVQVMTRVCKFWHCSVKNQGCWGNRVFPVFYYFMSQSSSFNVDVNAGNWATHILFIPPVTKFSLYTFSKFSFANAKSIISSCVRYHKIWQQVSLNGANIEEFSSCGTSLTKMELKMYSKLFPNLRKVKIRSFYHPVQLAQDPAEPVFNNIEVLTLEWSVGPLESIIDDSAPIKALHICSRSKMFTKKDVWKASHLVELKASYAWGEFTSDMHGDAIEYEALYAKLVQFAICLERVWINFEAALFGFDSAFIRNIGRIQSTKYLHIAILPDLNAQFLLNWVRFYSTHKPIFGLTIGDAGTSFLRDLASILPVMLAEMNKKWQYFEFVVPSMGFNLRAVPDGVYVQKLQNESVGELFVFRNRSFETMEQVNEINAEFKFKYI